MLTVKTKSGSTYEVDDLNCRARRLGGIADPTKRFKADGEWRPYESVDVAVGRSMVVVWGRGDDGTGAPLVCNPFMLILMGGDVSPEDRVRTTMTSEVISIDQGVG